VQKACRLLRVLATPQPLRLADIAKQAALNKATALRLLETLIGEGFVQRDTVTKRFALGDEAVMLGAALKGRTHIRDHARPWLVRLAALSGDTVLLSTRSGIESICVDRESGNYPIRANYLDIGSRRPLGIGAGSLALLAWLNDAEIAAILDQVEPMLHQRHPRIDRGFLERAVQTSRHAGYVLMLDVVVEQMGGVAVPVFGSDVRPVAAISIAALSERLKSRLDILVPAMQEAARALSAGPALSTQRPRHVGADVGAGA
jgi:DNA-binding IclR family transcriptional regulator